MKKLISVLIILCLIFSLIPNYLVYGVIENKDDGRIRIQSFDIDVADVESFYTYEDIHDENGKEIDVTTEGHEYVYENVLRKQFATIFDVQGRVNNAWQSTTFDDFGYWTVLKVNNNEPKLYFAQNNVVNGVKLDLTADIINNGNYFKINYEVENTTSQDVTFSLGSFADVQVCENDEATISRMDENQGVRLYDSDEDVQFTFYGRNVIGVTNVDNIWIGQYPDHQTNYFNGNSRTVLQGKDSAYAYSWTNRSLAAGETKYFSVLIGIGKISNPPQIELLNDYGDIYQSQDVVIEGRVTDIDEDSVEKIYYQLDDGEEVLLREVDLIGNSYDFEIDLSDKNLAVDTTHNLRIWAIDEKGNPSNEINKEILIATINAPELIMNENWTKDNVSFKIVDSLNNPVVIQKYQYKIDEGEWQDISLDTETLALNKSGVAVVQAKAISTLGKESNVVFKTAKVDKKAPAVEAYETNYNVTINAEDKESGLENVKYIWSKTRTFPDVSLTNYTGSMRYTGNELDTIYLHVASEDKVGNETKYTKEYTKPEPPQFVTQKKFIQENPKIGLSDARKQYEKGYMYKIKVDDEDWRFLDIDATYEITNPELRDYVIKTITIDTLGRESVPNETRITYSLGEPEEELDATKKVYMVTMSPTKVSLYPGNTQNFVAKVIATGLSSNELGINYKVENKSSENTTINQSGALTIGADETSKSLTVTATSKYDTTKYATSTVNIIPLLPDEEPINKPDPNPVKAVTKVTINPNKGDLKPGDSMSFAAAVEGEHLELDDMDVTYKVGNNTSDSTIITKDGKLTVGEDEKSASLNVVAISIFDPSKQALAAINVEQPEKPIIEKVEEPKEPTETEKPKQTSNPKQINYTQEDNTIAKEPYPNTGALIFGGGIVVVLLYIVINSVIYKIKYKDV